MSFRKFKLYFEKILREKPLPGGHIWKMQTLQDAGLRDDQDWFEVLYRAYGYYQCDHAHSWKSSWSMILFRCRLDLSTGVGRARMKRFGLRCSKCEDDNTYHMWQLDDKQTWYIVQCLLLHILQRCYERRRDCDIDVLEHIIPVGNVSRGRFGGMPHPRHLCEACAHNRCQEIYKTLTKNK